MPLLDLGVQKLYDTVFGPFASPWDQAKLKKYDNLTALENVPLYMPTQIQQSRSGEALSMFQLPNTPLISISGSKSIIKSQIDGQKGTFKEGFSIDDYQITIRGMIIQPDDSSEEYPDELVRKVRRICELQTSLKVQNDLLLAFGVSQIVIESYDFPDFPGAPSVQPYVISCLSDQEFNLEFKNVQNR